MTRKPRSFSPEFRPEAASLVLDQGYTIPQGSLSLGIGESAIRRWVNRLTGGCGGVTPTGKALTRNSAAFRCMGLMGIFCRRFCRRSPISAPIAGADRWKIAPVSCLRWYGRGVLRWAGVKAVGAYLKDD